MAKTTTARPFPLPPLIAAGVAVAFTIIVSAVASITGFGKSVETSAPIASSQLYFIDRDDGGVGVLTAPDRREVDVLAPGSNNFLRATLRGLVRQRKREDLGAEIPFRLTAWADGRLTLEDPATGRTVDLGAFGETNAAVFGKLLTDAVRTEHAGLPSPSSTAASGPLQGHATP